MVSLRKSNQKKNHDDDDDDDNCSRIYSFVFEVDEMNEIDWFVT